MTPLGRRRWKPKNNQPDFLDPSKKKGGGETKKKTENPLSRKGAGNRGGETVDHDLRYHWPVEVRGGVNRGGFERKRLVEKKQRETRIVSNKGKRKRN